MEGLMQHELEKRMTAAEAASKILWVDHWRETGSEESSENGQGEEEWESGSAK
jgi:hypothetical protein